MTRNKKTYRSFRGKSHMITRVNKPAIVFTDGLLRTSDPDVIKYIESLSDFGKGIRLHYAEAAPRAVKTPKPKAKAANAEQNEDAAATSTMIVDSIDTVNEAQEFLVGKGVPRSKIMVKKDLLVVASGMGISFPALEAKK